MIKKLNGWIFIDKPPDISSFDVIKIVKKILKINKLGHSGTLDPFATGVLAIALGEATKSIKYFNSEKTYDFDITFGESKDTDDIKGKTIKSSDLIPDLEEIKKVLPEFLGQIEQIPPKFSAVKVNGVRAYKLARREKNFDLKAKKILIHSIDCFDNKKKHTFSFLMSCSSGTYVRSFARDLAKRLNTYAYVSKLRRTEIGKFGEKDIILLDKLSNLVHIGDHFKTIHPVEDVLDDIPAVNLKTQDGMRFKNGLEIKFFSKDLSLENLLVFANGNLIGVGKIIKGLMSPKRGFNLN